MEEKKEVELKNDEQISEHLKIKEQNDLLEKELARRDELLARQKMSGKSQASDYPPQKSEQELIDAEAKRVLAMFR